MPKTKTPKQQKPEIMPRGRVARRIKGFSGQVTDLGNQLEDVRKRLHMVETGETEPYLAAVSKRQTALQERLDAMHAKQDEDRTAIAKTVEILNQMSQTVANAINAIGELESRIGQLEEALDKHAEHEDS